MATYLSTFFRERRLALGMRFGEIARLMGYKSLPGCCNKLIYFEERGIISQELMVKLAAVLGIDDETIAKLAEKDRREQFEKWTSWANQPIRPYVLVKLLPAVFTQEQVPIRIMNDQAAMERFAAELARKWKMQAVLVLSRRISIYFSETGKKLFVNEAGMDQSMNPKRRRRSFFFLTKPEEPDGD